MKSLSALLVLIICFFLFAHIQANDSVKKMTGLTFVAPPTEFQNNPMKAVQAAHAAWIAVVPYAYTHKSKAGVQYNESEWQWWGERPEGVIATIQKAHQNYIQVMLKPQVYVPGGWTGDLYFEAPDASEKWEAEYTDYILDMARIADTCGVALFCIGTEFRQHISARPDYWERLIRDVRGVYSGKLTYSANWDDYMDVPFWEALDYIGISAYYPLVEKETPSVRELQKAWQPIVKNLAAFSEKKNQQILFTEYGYLSTDFCAWRTWELEQKIHQMPINEEAQANALDALLSVFCAEKWWAGGFLWKWFPNGAGHEGYPEKDYTPQGKRGAVVLAKHYAKCNGN